jgi:hypothetical protein
MSLTAVRLLKKMRGGAQAHLIEANDGDCYVVKFLENTQHRRILINEWIASALLRYLDIATPATKLIHVDRCFLSINPEVYLQLGDGRRVPSTGIHFASRYPVKPSEAAVYDYLPDALLERIENPTHFLGILLFDKWTGNTDARQALFFRRRKGGKFLAQMLDHGSIFDGAHWRFQDSPIHGTYFRPLVYRNFQTIADVGPWLDLIQKLPASLLQDAVKEIPATWLKDDEPALRRLIERLLLRRDRLPGMIEDLIRRAVVPESKDWPTEMAL